MHFIIPSTIGINKDSSSRQQSNPQKQHHMMINQGINNRLCHLGLLDQLLNLFKIKKDHVSDQFKIILIKIISNKYLHHLLIISQLLIQQTKILHQNNKTLLTILIVSQLIQDSSLFVWLHKGQAKDKKMAIQIFKIHEIMLQIQLSMELSKWQRLINLSNHKL